MATPPVIATTGLSKRYGATAALEDLHLCVPRHAICGFLGPNGAGKTTTIKLLLGLMRPSAGTGTIFGHDIVRDSLAIRTRVGYLPQQPAFYPELTARETLRFTASFFYHGPSHLIEARIKELLHLVGLEAKADRAVGGFSGGERQRLGIAQAQLNEPDLLILDEPAAALDPLGRRDVLTIMERLRSQTTIFYSTHILDDVQQVSDTVVIMHQGRLVRQGPITALLHGGQPCFTVTLSGDSTALTQRLSQVPWIAQISVSHQNGTTEWQIAVDDEASAERELFRLLAQDAQVTVHSYGRTTVELETIFMQLVEGASHAR
ncbi:MAG: ABC transporter ATP-binding protein [Chloroflexia bacterium]|nr:ABC transporter ATP-binding protein [Chloroflexia bacterium]